MLICHPFLTLPIEPDCTTMTAMQCDLPCNPCDLVQPMLTSTHTQHYHRHLIVLVIGFRHNTQAPHFTAPFMPHMTLLGFMCPSLGKLIRSWVLYHCTINKPHDILPLSHSPSLDQLPLLCTPLVFATYHALYSTHTTASTPTIAFVLISPVHTDKKGWTEYTPPYTPHFAPLPQAHTLSHTHTILTLCPALTLAPHLPLLSYLFTYLALLSSCIQLDLALFHSFSPIITNIPIHLLLHYTLLHTCSHSHLHYTPLFSSLHTWIETVPYPLISPSEPHRAFIVIKPHSSYFTIAAAP